MVGTRRVSYHEPEAEGVSSSQNSSQNTISEITPAASTGSQTRTSSQWTPDQQEQLFRAELAGKELDNRLKEAQLRRLEIEATVGLSPTTVNPAHAPGLSPALSQSQEIGKNDPPKVTSVSQLHPGVSRDLIRKIFDNQFYPDRLSKLRPCHGTEHITDSAIRWEGGDLKVGPTKGDYKDFGKDCWIWSEGFQIYISIYSQFWAPKFPNLTTSMISFHRRILRLSQIYIWQGGVLKLALERHMDILHNGHTDALPLTTQTTSRVFLGLPFCRDPELIRIMRDYSTDLVEKIPGVHDLAILPASVSLQFPAGNHAVKKDGSCCPSNHRPGGE